MSIETCSIHLNYVLVNEQYPLVALLNNRIVGEIEVYVGVERGILGKTAFIDVLEVHRDYRRKGIGRRLVEEARRIALENKCDTISVWPNPEAIGFYKKCGIKETAYKIIIAELNVKKILEKNNSVPEIIVNAPREYEWYMDKYFVAPRIISSYTAWLKRQWVYAVELNRIMRVHGYLPELEAVFTVESMWDDKWKGRLYLWIKDLEEVERALEAIAYYAWTKGFQKLLLITWRELLENTSIGNYRIVGEEVLLYEKLV